MCNGNTWFWADCAAQSNRQRRVYDLNGQLRDAQHGAEQAKANAAMFRSQRMTAQANAAKRQATTLTKRTRTLATSIRKTETLIARHQADSIRRYERSHR